MADMSSMLALVPVGATRALRRWALASGTVGAIGAAACVASAPAAEHRTGRAEGRRDASGPIVRVSVAAGVPTGKLSATGDWRLYDGAGRSTIVRGLSGDLWSVERAAGRLRAVRADGVPTSWQQGQMLARPIGAGAMLTWNGKRYRGELVFHPTDSGLLVVNRLPVEEYLRGVVPLEVGPRTPAEHAAVEAQAVAARSYTIVRLPAAGAAASTARPFDVVNTVFDQVYGGANAETPVGDAAIRATAGLVLTYAGRVVNAPYSSTCGGSTAELPEVWHRQPGQPYLKRVSDRIPGTTDRFYCDPSSRFRWTSTFTGPQLASLIDRYARQYASVPAGPVGVVRAVRQDGTTASGRAAGLRIDTDRGPVLLRGNDVRFVLRAPNGAILNSTYFSAEPVVGRDGRLQQLTIRGTGYGHGIGMCQWGAIGRARAGQDFRTILRTYYPGTVVEPAD